MQRRLWTAAIAIATVSVMGGVGVRAQDAFQLLSGALVGEKAAYIPLPAEPVGGRQVMAVTPGPDGRDALIQTMSLPPTLAVADLLGSDTGTTDQQLLQKLKNGGRIDFNLLLWSEDARKAQTVWRGGGNLQTGLSVPVSVQWFAGSRIGILQVVSTQGPLTPEQANDGTAKRTISLLRVNGATGKTQPLGGEQEADAQLILSPSEPVGAIVSESGNTVQTVSASGTVGAVAKVSGIKRRDGDGLYWVGWSPGSKSLRGVHYGTGEDGKRFNRRLLLDTVTGAVTEDTAPKVTRPAAPPVPEPLPFVVHQGRENLTRDGVKTTVYPLWPEGRDKSLTGRTLLSADSEPGTPPIELQTAILYRLRGQLYVVPLLKANAADFIAQRQAAQKAETIKRAKQIGTAAMMYAQDYDENFPPIGSKWGETVNPHVKNPDVFQSPVAGMNGFTPVYKILGIAGYETPATTPLGYLDGPGGRAVVYIDGHVKWEDTPKL